MTYDKGRILTSKTKANGKDRVDNMNANEMNKKLNVYKVSTAAIEAIYKIVNARTDKYIL